MAAPAPRRPGFSRRAQWGLFWGYVFLVAGSLIAAGMLALATFDPSTFGALRLAVSEVTAPLSTGVAMAGSAINSTPAVVSDYFLVRTRNEELRKEIDDMHALIVRARAISVENRRLKRLMRTYDQTVDPVATARLVSSSASSTRRYAILNAGFRQGVHAGQPVRGPDGLIGRILEAGPDTARVLLLGDPESIVPVRRTRDGLPAIASGRGDGLLEIKAANLADGSFKEGDLLVTSGTGGIYGPNIPVATVMSRTRDTVLAKPLEIPDSFDYALVQKAYLPAAAAPEPKSDQKP
ncbi:rod shape-determining protein MreC [Sphingomonas sp. GlSt437]|uniref:rod shape-determining protein MreC n=1 Tax=Sphingomonas sp. GlSt437 TaxID=3389970 RepID=UPI003A8742C8